MPLDGLVVPVPTLFTDAGDLDVGRNARYARGLADARVDHLFVLGSLGEFPGVTDEERPWLSEAVIDAVAGTGTDTWIGCGAPSTRQAVRYAQQAEAQGAAVIVAVPPYYLHPSPAAIDRYFRAIRAAIGVPLLAYNIPALVGYALTPELLHRLYEDGVIAGTKDTSGTLDSVRAFLRGAPTGFVVLPGDDGLVAASIAEGAPGAVMGTANLVPRLGVELVREARAGHSSRAIELQALVDAVVDVIRAGPFPSVDKFLAAELRRADVGYRAPYDPLSAAEASAVLARLDPLRERLRPFLEP